MTVAPSSAAGTEAVTQLVLRERQSRDRGRWQEMAECGEGTIINVAGMIAFHADRAYCASSMR